MKKFPLMTVFILILVIGLVACTPAGSGTEGTSNSNEESAVAEPTAAAEPTAETTENEEGEESMQESNALEGQVWALESWRNEAGEMVPAIADSGASAEFRDGQLSGNGGCNGFSGSYELNGNELTIGQIASTLMLCTPEELGTQETAYFAHLQNAATYQITDGQLEISNDAGEVTLTFTILEAAPLTGTTWTLTNYNNGQGGVTTLLPDTEITAVFGEDGRLNGLAGCNNYMSSYTVEGSNLTIQPPASTRKLCPEEGVMEQETAFLAGLENVTSYRIRGNQLDLLDASGSLIASFSQAEG